MIPTLTLKEVQENLTQPENLIFSILTEMQEKMPRTTYRLAVKGKLLPILVAKANRVATAAEAAERAGLDPLEIEGQEIERETSPMMVRANPLNDLQLEEGPPVGVMKPRKEKELTYQEYDQLETWKDDLAELIEKIRRSHRQAPT